MSNTKIVVVKLKELILTTALVLAGVVTLMLMIFLISGNKNHSDGSGDAPTSALYHPGVYTSSMTLNDTTIHLELVCDANHINSVRLVNLDEAVETMYPLLNPALSDLELQLAKDIPVSELVLTDGSKYTQTLLIEAIEQTLRKAEITE
ncbi:MAG: hypothetical protein E7260_02590 [Lachnospiraceae bacterium]|nr:hypothetical protein [Lachnospiraceae bacterium]